MAKKHRVKKPPPAPVALQPPSREVFPIPTDGFEAWLAEFRLSSVPVYLHGESGLRKRLTQLADGHLRHLCKEGAFVSWSYAPALATESESEKSS